MSKPSPPTPPAWLADRTIPPPPMPQARVEERDYVERSFVDILRRFGRL